MPARKPIVTSSGSSGASATADGPFEDVLRGPRPRVLEDPALGGAAPGVLVDRVGRLLALDGDRDPALEGVVDRGVTGQPPLPDRREGVEVRGEAHRADLEAHLVVALPGAAVGDARGTGLARDRHEVLHDQRA
jgi:hypothetical protein